MRVNPSDRKACRACQAEIVFAQTNRVSQGKPVVMPVDAEPDPKGNIMLELRGDTYYAGTLGRNQAAGARDNGVSLHLPHFATCTQSDRFRKNYGTGGKS